MLYPLSYEGLPLRAKPQGSPAIRDSALVVDAAGRGELLAIRGVGENR